MMKEPPSGEGPWCCIATVVRNGAKDDQRGDSKSSFTIKVKVNKNDIHTPLGMYPARVQSQVTSPAKSSASREH